MATKPALTVNVYHNDGKYLADTWPWHGAIYDAANRTLATCRALDRDSCEVMIEGVKAWLEDKAKA